MQLTHRSLVLVPAAAAAVLLGFDLTRADAMDEVLLLGAAITTLALGHVALHSRRRQARAEAEAGRTREQLELRERVGECERRREHLSAFARLAAHVSHEVRNPLSSISLNLELLEEEFRESDCARGPMVRQLIGSLQSEAARLKLLTDEYLAFSRPRSPLLAPEDLNGLALDLTRFLGGEALRSGIVITAQPSASPVLASIDRHQVKQALMNLVRNAIQATPAGGQVEIRPFVAAGKACISVADTGPGVPEPDRCRIFEPFFTTKTGGTGLGLPLALHIAREHGGEITVASGLERGAVFTMTLADGPAASEPAAGHAELTPFEAAS